MKLQTGWHTIAHDAYHSKLEAVGSTTLNNFYRSAAHGKHCMDNPDDEQQLRLGAVIHMAILEEREFGELPVEPPGDGRTKAVKDAREEFRNKLSGKKYTSFKDFQVAVSVRNILNNHPTWKALCSINGVNETTGVYDDGSGIVLKIKPDRRADSGFLIDLKTTDDARQKNFDNQIIKNGYDLQAAFYFDTANKISPGAYKKFIWVAIEIEPPYGVMFYDVGDLWLEIGREKYKQALLKYVNAKLSKKYEGYTEEIVVSVPPAYASFY